jgi:hypothetical protein
LALVVAVPAFMVALAARAVSAAVVVALQGLHWPMPEGKAAVVSLCCIL